ncbi:MAG: ABC transporter ATP-binding protein [Bacteroidales bacterium]|jgi:ABC-2 type transport system ATP-binding protein|nr:ABC transporter ATP-binding protein [Bacteroidales bacterium]
MMQQNAIEINGISKSYGTLKALGSITFNVGRGEVFGLIGPDGAGKSTLFRILVTLINSDSGTAKVDGLDVLKDYHSIRNKIGYMPGKFSLYPDLTVEENVNFFAALFHVTLEQNYDLIAPIYKQIEPFKSRRAGNLSGGMKQKLALCCSLIHKPDVLFLDEPTTGVDAVSRSEFWDMLLELQKKGLSILVSTPYMDEAGRCNRIALINGGKILDINTPDGIVNNFKEPLYAISGTDMYGILAATRKEKEVIECYPFGAAHHIVASEKFNPEILKQTLEKQGFKNIELNKTRAGIEDVFIKLMRKQ